MSYAELKEKAKELGIPYLGLSKSELERDIAEFNGEKLPEETTKDEDMKEDTTEDVTSEDEKTKDLEDEKEEPPFHNTAIVKQNGYEVRRYTSEIHGKKYAELAQQFADARTDHRVELVMLGEPKYCKNCGSILND